MPVRDVEIVGQAGKQIESPGYVGFLFAEHNLIPAPEDLDLLALEAEILR